MATENTLDCRSKIAGADLSTKQFYVVKLNSSGQIVLAGDGEAAYGILQDKPASAAVGAVAVAGQSLAVLGGTVAAGAKVASNASGQVVTATTGEYVIGTCTEGGAVNEVRSIEIENMGPLA